MDTLQLIKEWVDWLDNRVVIGADYDGGINVVFYNGNEVVAGTCIEDYDNFELCLNQLAKEALGSFQADK